MTCITMIFRILANILALVKPSMYFAIEKLKITDINSNYQLRYNKRNVEIYTTSLEMVIMFIIRVLIKIK